MIKDSGARTEFATGARRDIQHGKGRMDLLPWYGIMEVSKHCEEGAEKYGEHNVDKGIPLHSLCDSAARHLAKFIAGEMDEDHLRAAAWNLLWALNQRKTHPELDDLYSHKETVEKVRNLVDEFNKAKTNGEVVFEDGPDTINEECETDIRPLLYDPEKFTVYDTNPLESLKETKGNDIKPKEPTAIEPLSKELLLGMNGRFVYLVQRFENSDGSCNFVSIGWVRIKVDDDNVFIVTEDEHHEDISQQKWDPSWMDCYIADPKNYKE